MNSGKEVSGSKKSKKSASSGESAFEKTARKFFDLISYEKFRAISATLIVVAIGIGFGKIMSVEAVNDRAIQDYRLRQLPSRLEERIKELRERGVDEERIKQEEARIGNALLKDALKARPTLSANDRSRWSTIRALVEKDARVYRYTPVMNESQKATRAKELAEKYPDSPPGFRYLPSEILINCSDDCPERFDPVRASGKRYVKTLVPYAVDKAWETPGWDSIDVVKHGLPDEIWDPANPSSGYHYSSKPPLLPTVMAAPYWVLNRVFKLDLKKDPFLTTRILLVFYNLIPLAIAFYCLARTIDLLGRSDWAKFFALAATLFGFFTLTFVATLNNHIPGFVAISIALWAACEIIYLGKNDAWRFFCAGFFGAFAVVCELPALAFAALLCLALLVKRPTKTILVSIPAGLVVAAAFFATNYIAHGTYAPAYAHKRDHMALQQALAEASKTRDADNDATSAPIASFDPNDWYYYVYYPAGRPRQPEYAALSHWANRTGVDRGEPSIARYAFHSTIGLRGVFSLTPIWLLSLAGIFIWLFEGNRGLPESVNDASDEEKELLAAAERARRNFTKAHAFSALVLTVVFFAFFFTRDQGDRNYGGLSCCPRWFFPLAPLFLLCLLSALEKIGTSRIGRLIAYIALLISVLSVFYPTWNPWTSPWLYQYAVEGGFFQPY